ncbi:hypothetical protein MTO96_050358 [Rhipicephalus appendiculatus]
MRVDRPVHRNHYRTSRLPSTWPAPTPGTRRATQQPQLAVGRRRLTYYLRTRRLASLYDAACSCRRSPPNSIRIVVRLRGELQLRDVPTPRLRMALQAELQITLPDDFYVPMHPTNNTFTAATTHSSTEILNTLILLSMGGHTYPCVAYVAPPPGATRGVISNAFDHHTPTQLYKDLVRRNPEYIILAA